MSLNRYFSKEDKWPEIYLKRKMNPRMQQRGKMT